jgi:hypothetical protein
MPPLASVHPHLVSPSSCRSPPCIHRADRRQTRRSSRSRRWPDFPFHLSCARIPVRPAHDRRLVVAIDAPATNAANKTQLFLTSQDAHVVIWFLVVVAAMAAPGELEQWLSDMLRDVCDRRCPLTNYNQIDIWLLFLFDKISRFLQLHHQFGTCSLRLRIEVWLACVLLPQSVVSWKQRPLHQFGHGFPSACRGVRMITCNLPPTRSVIFFAVHVAQRSHQSIRQTNFS